MGQMAAIGERALVEGYALAGVTVIIAEDPGAVRQAWRTLPADVSIVVLTTTAAAALDAAVLDAIGGDRMVVTLP